MEVIIERVLNLGVAAAPWLAWQLFKDHRQGQIIRDLTRSVYKGTAAQNQTADAVKDLRSWLLNKQS